MIKLPSHLWFMGLISFRGPGNTYSGSMGCDPAKGNIGKIFRYVVKIVPVGEDLQLKAVYYVGENALEATDPSIVTEKMFESSTEGILEAQDWLNAAAEEFNKNEGV